MKDRQAIANACGKVRREASSLFGRVDGECECFDDASFPLVWPFSQAELRRGSATSGSSPLSPHSEDVSAAALAAYYREALRAPGALELGSLLDVGASSSRLLPVDLGLFFRVTRTGADASELEVDPTPRERALAEHDESPTLPYGDGAFDAVLCEGVIGGLCSPREVVAEWHRVLRPGGHVHASFSRSLPNATELWFAADDQGRKRYVASIFHFSPRAGWRDITVVQLSEPGEGTDGSYVLRACKT